MRSKTMRGSWGAWAAVTTALIATRALGQSTAEWQAAGPSPDKPAATTGTARGPLPEGFEGLCEYLVRNPTDARAYHRRSLLKCPFLEESVARKLQDWDYNAALRSDELTSYLWMDRDPRAATTLNGQLGTGGPGPGDYVENTLSALRRDDLAAARTTCTEGFARYPDTAQLAALEGIMKFKHKEYGTAIELLTRALKLDAERTEGGATSGRGRIPPRWCYYCARALVNLFARDKEAALSDLDQAAQISSTAGLRELRQSLREALRMVPANSDSSHLMTNSEEVGSRRYEHIHRALVELCRGRRAEAKAALAAGSGASGLGFGIATETNGLVTALYEAIDGATASIDRLDELHALIAAAPGDFGLIRDRAELLHSRRQWKAAAADYTRIVERNENDAEAYLQRGYCRAKEKDWAGALADYRHAYAKRDASGSRPIRLGEFFLYRAEALQATGDVAGAIADLETAIREAPDDPAPHRRLAWLAYEGKMWEIALREYAAVVRLQPDNLAAHMNLGHLHTIHGRTQEAVDSYSRALEIDPRNDRVIAIRATAYELRKEFDRALADRNKVVELKPNDADSYVARAKLHGLRGAPQAAFDDCTSAVRVVPDRAEVLNLRGEYALQLERPEQALEDFSRAIALDKKSAYYESRAHAWWQVDEVDKASADIDEALRLESPTVKRLQMRAHLLMKKGDDESAFATYTSALRLAPRNASMLGDRGCLQWFRLRRRADAFADLEAAEAAAPDSIEWHIASWGIRKAAGDEAGAAAAWERLLKTPGFRGAEFARFGFAALAEEYGDFAEAARGYEAMLADLPAGAPARAPVVLFQAALQATAPNAELRDGRRAAEAVRAVAETKGPLQQAALWVLAAAEAEMKDFEAAAASLERARDMAPSSKAAVLRKHLEVVRRGEPIRCAPGHRLPRKLVF